MVGGIIYSYNCVKTQVSAASPICLYAMVREVSLRN